MKIWQNILAPAKNNRVLRKSLFSVLAKKLTTKSR